MTLDMLAVADALALRYAPANIVPPVGQTNIKKSTARPSNSAPGDPFVHVLLDDGEVIYAGRRKGEHHFLVRFHHSRKAGNSREAHMVLLKWVGVLLDATHAQSKLGLAVIDKAIPISYALSLFNYGGVEHNGIEIRVTVWTSDTYDLVPA